MKAIKTFKANWNKLIKRQSDFLKKSLFIVITIASLSILSGCQETSMASKTLLPNVSNNENIYTLTNSFSGHEYPKNITHENKVLGKVYLIGTPSYAEKLMSLYKNNNTQTLNARSNNRNQVHRKVSVPILMITF